MKIYAVMSNYTDPEGGEHSFVEAVFATEELAKEHVHYNLGNYSISTFNVLSEETKMTTYTKKAISEGKMKIVGKSHVFGGK